MQIRSGRHPHEVAMLGAAFLIGVVGLAFFNQVATALVRALPHPFGHILYGGLAAGAAIALAGVFRRGILPALLERSGLTALAVFLLIYAVAVVVNSGLRGLAFSVFVGAFSLANLIRVRQIGREIDEYQAARVILTRQGKGGDGHELG